MLRFDHTAVHDGFSSNMTVYLMQCVVLVAGKEGFSVTMVIVVVVCIVGVIVLAIVLRVKIQKAKVSSHVW